MPGLGVGVGVGAGLLPALLFGGVIGAGVGSIIMYAGAIEEGLAEDTENVFGGEIKKAEGGVKAHSVAELRKPMTRGFAAAYAQ